MVLAALQTAQTLQVSTMNHRLVYIKLGAGSVWADACIAEGKIRIGFEDISKAIFITEDLALIRQAYIDIGCSPRAADTYKSQLNTFFEANSEVIWITFHKQKLWWCKAKDGYVYDLDGSKYKEVLGRWSDSDLSGKTLWEDNLSGALIKTKSYLSTLCIPDAHDYAWNKIHCLQSNEAITFENDLAALRKSTVNKIKKLRWQDFELLIDLIFRNAGYQRIGVVGKDVKTIDISLLQPLTSEKVFVQIKSAASFKTYKDWKNEVVIKNSNFTQYYFTVHTPSPELSVFDEKENSNFSLWREKEISEMVIRFGLIDWILQKAG